MSGPESVSGLGSYGRAVTGSSISAHSGLVLDHVPGEILPAKAVKTRPASSGKGALLKLLDGETQLGKEELLLGPDEGLIDEESLAKEENNFEKLLMNPLIGSTYKSLFESKTTVIVEQSKAPRCVIQSTSGQSSEHVYIARPGFY